MSRTSKTAEMKGKEDLHSIPMFLYILVFLTCLLSSYLWLAYSQLRDETATLKTMVDNLNGLVSSKNLSCSQGQRSEVYILAEKLRELTVNYQLLNQKISKLVSESELKTPDPQILPIAKEILSSVSSKLGVIKDNLATNIEEIDKQYKISEKKQALKEKLIEKNKLIQQKVSEGGAFLKEKAIKGGDYVKQKSVEGLSKIKSAAAKGTEYISEKTKKGAEYLKAKAKGSGDYLKASISENFDRLKNLWNGWGNASS